MTDDTITTAGALKADLRAYRQRLGLTLADVCQRAQARGHRLDKSDLSKLERGELAWNDDRLEAVSDALGLKPTWVIGA